MTLRTRKPTGLPSWPLILVEGAEKSGKSWAAATFTASDRIGRSLWLDIGEGVGDAYGEVPGADYELIVHDGTWYDILDQVQAAHEEAAKALAAGEKPTLLVIDSMTAVWSLLKKWTNERARSSRSGQKKLAEDPNAEIDPTMNLWNDANDRHDQLMGLLMTFPGVVVMTARGKEIAVLDAAGQPVKGKKDYRVEGQKSLAYASSAWIRMSRDAPPTIIGLWSTRIQHQPGVHDPAPDPDLSLDRLTFDVLGCGETTQARALPARPELSVVAEQARAAVTRDEITEVWKLAKGADYLDIVTDTGNTVREILTASIELVKAAATEQAAAQEAAQAAEQTGDTAALDLDITPPKTDEEPHP